MEIHNTFCSIISKYPIHRLLSLLNGFIKGINSSTPTVFFKHETFTLLIVDVPTNKSMGITFIATLTYKEINAFKHEHHNNGRFFNIELATHFNHTIPTKSITVMVPPLIESNFSRSKNYGSPIQRFSFCVFIQDKLFMPFNETSEKLSSIIVGIGIKGTRIASSTESIIIEFVIPKVNLVMAKQTNKHFTVNTYAHTAEDNPSLILLWEMGSFKE